MKRILVFCWCVLSLSGMGFDPCSNQELLWRKTQLDQEDFEAISLLLVSGLQQQANLQQPATSEQTPEPLAVLPQQLQRKPSFERARHTSQNNATKPDIQVSKTLSQSPPAKSTSISSPTPVVGENPVEHKKPVKRGGKRVRVRHTARVARTQGQSGDKHA